MTAGTTTTGSWGQGYYRYRNWVGGDGSRDSEHEYTYHIRESELIPVKYGYVFWPAMMWDGSMSTFSPGLPQSSTDLTSNLVNQAAGKVWEDLSQSKFNLGVFSGEFRESYRMVCDAVLTLGKAIRLARRGQFDRSLRVLAGARRRGFIDEATKVASNSWMVWHFGVIPLMQDIIAAYEFMTTHYRVVKEVRKAAIYRDVKRINYTTSGVSWQWSIKAVAEIRGEIAMLELSAMDRLGLNDLPTVAWELTRLSWMIDWLVPIGNFLQAVNASNKTRGERIWLTRMQKETLMNPQNAKTTYNIVPFDAGAFEHFFQPGSANSRTVYSGVPWACPTIQNPLGDHLSRWITSFAFLRQVVR